MQQTRIGNRASAVGFPALVFRTIKQELDREACAIEAQLYHRAGAAVICFNCVESRASDTDPLVSRA